VRARTVAVGAAIALLGASIGFALGSARAGDADADRSGAADSPSPVKLVKVGGIFMAARSYDLPAAVEPYEYTAPAPPRTPTPIDGTYFRVTTFSEVGGPVIGLPYRCLRCIPYRIVAGLTTLIFVEGRFFLEHQLSGFRGSGHFTVHGNRLRIYNDSNCSSMTGTYRWAIDHRQLRLEVIDDPCAFGDERSRDLTTGSWVKVNQCSHRLIGLWPAVVGCKPV
jgi:hypothetical protein